MTLVEKIKSTVLTDTQSALWYIGQEGFIIKNKDSYVAIDPYLTDYVDRHCSDRAAWKRLYPTPVEAAELDFLDAVLCTHAHFDHADPDTLSAIAKASEKTLFIVPAPVAEKISSYGIEKDRIIPAVDGETVTVCGTLITPVAAAHEEFHTDEEGRYFELSYIIENESGRFFHGGDLCVYDGLAQRLTDIDVGFLPINGRDYYRNSKGIIGNLNCEEAVLLAKESGMDMLVPMHYDLYEVNRVTEAVFADTLERLNVEQKHHFFKPGERYIFSR